LEIGRTVLEPIPQQDRKPLPLPAAGVAARHRGGFDTCTLPGRQRESSRPAGGQRQESREENLDVVESLRRSRIKLIVTRHEQAAAFMAATRGRLTGKPGVCLATLGPGALEPHHRRRAKQADLDSSSATAEGARHGPHPNSRRIAGV
jgi:hypothetical protein